MSKQTNTTRTASTALTGDAAQAVAVLDWARGAGVDVSELTVGKVSIKVRGTAGAGEQVSDRDEERRGARPTIHETFGGELYAAAAAEKLPGVELQPAIGRRAG